ncbi:MAG: efflux RND transporter periplasmic adaptor subunit [Chlamydiae bacterium]|nr:efflux RND transporter periplasmic adaptor subunit [Chlamydiota bacterium]
MKSYLLPGALGVAIAFLIVGGLWFFTHKEASDSLTLYGNVDVRQVDISFRVAGRVKEMAFEEGDFVAQGTFMGSLEKEPYSDEVEEAKANLASFKTQLANADDRLQRRQELVGEGGVSQEDYDNTLCSRDTYLANIAYAEAALKVSLKNLEDTVVSSPSDGVILTRVREVGSVVQLGEPIYTLSLTSPIWVRAFVNEPQLGDIYFGMAADIFTDTKNAPVYKGHIGFISPVAEFTPKTVQTLDLRTDLVYRLRVIVDNPDWGLKQGMPVTVKLYPKRAYEKPYPAPRGR